MNFTSESVTQQDINKSIAKQFIILHREYYGDDVDHRTRIAALQEYVKLRQTPKGHAEFIACIQNGSFHEKYDEYLNEKQK